MIAHPFTDQALKYCDDVLSLKIVACKQIVQAVKRHLDDLSKIDSDPSYPYTFDLQKAERVCQFVSKLPHVSGKWAVLKNNKFVLQPWQCFFLTTLFGWVHKESGYRRFQEALLSVSRKNGKSFLASGICLFCFLCDLEPGAQVFSAANNMEQAQTVFRPAKLMVDQLPDLRNAFEIESNVKSLILPDGSRFVPLVGIPHDGQSTHLAILDEYHESKSDDLYLSLRQSMGARTSPLLLITTTAGISLEGPCHQFQRECEEMLSGKVDRPELFALIFTIDRETDWTSEVALKMANPNLGISVNITGLKTDHNNAIRNASKQNPFKTKHLNVWCSSASNFFNMALWSDCGDSELRPEMFLGKPCWMSGDLSSKLDLTCVTTVFKDGNLFYSFQKFYLPASRAKDPALGMYSKWVQQGFLNATEGNVIDLEHILDDTVADIERFQPTEFGFDKWHSDLFINGIGKRCPNTTLVEIPMEVRFISPAMLEIEAMLEAKTIRHNNNPVQNWCISNVVAFRDRKENVYPRKTRNENKIDGSVSLMLAVSRTLVHKEQEAAFEPFFA